MGNRVGRYESGPPPSPASNIRAVALSFKDAIERDKRAAPEGMREDALTGMWNFAPVRQEMKREIAALADYFRTGADIPADFVPRIARLSVAMYLLDKIQEISEAAAKNRSVSAVALFDVARRSVETLLDVSFFSKPPEAVRNGFLDAEPALSSCGAAFGVPLLGLEDAVRAYKMKAAQAVESELGPR